VDDAREARDLGVRLGLGRSAAIAINNLADSLSWYVGLGPAREVWGEGIEFSRDRGLLETAMWQRGERLKCLYHEGDWDEALAEAAEILAWVGETGAPLEVYARVPVAGIRLHRGDLDGARAEVEALVPSARRSGDPQVVVPGIAMAALVALAEGEGARALEHVAELERTTVGQAGWRSFCLAVPVRVAVSAGAPELAEAFLDSPTLAGWGVGARASAVALLAEARGRTDEAARSYRKAATSWAEYGSVLEQAYALLGLGRCGDASAAREADAIFARLGARPVLARAA